MRRSKAHCSVAVRDRRPTTRRGFSSASREIVYYGIDVVRQPTLTGSRKHGHHPGGTAEYEPTPGNASISRRFTLLGITLVTKMWSQVMDAEVHLLAGVRCLRWSSLTPADGVPGRSESLMNGVNRHRENGKRGSLGIGGAGPWAWV